MKFFYELKTCGCDLPVQSVVTIAFCHYLIYGLFAVIFVFTNECYPPLYYVDYMFGISGAALLGITLLSGLLAFQRHCQPLRIIFAIILLLNVLLIVVSTFYYTIKRWNDVMVTALASWTRSSLNKDFPDNLWLVLVVIACINGPILLFYMIHILSFMCNKKNFNLFSQPYQNEFGPVGLLRSVQVPSVPPYPSTPPNPSTYKDA